MSKLGILTVSADLTDDERVEQILDLTRKLRLLDELLRGARTRREIPIPVHV